MDSNDLFYRLNGSTKYIRGYQKGYVKNFGLCLAWRYGSKSAQVACAKLVRKGSKHADTGFFVRHNDIIFEAVRDSSASEYIVLDDCGQTFLATSSLTTSFDDGWFFTGFYGAKGGIMPDEGADPFSIDCTSPWTIAFKCKGTSDTGANYVGTVAALSSSGEWIIGQNPAAGENFFFGMRSNGQLFFRDYFQETVFDGSRSDWRDFKITFYPQNSSVYNDSLEQNVRPVNFSAVCNGVTKTGSTFYSDTYSSNDFFCKIGYNGVKLVVKGGSEKGGSLNGYIKYFSVSQDEIGYSDYRRDAHKVALYFD